MINNIRLTQYSHGAGCGCKISPKILDEIIANPISFFNDPNLLVGNSSKDDAAVYALDEKTAIISTTDFFMPIVDDPKDFGAIAATNAISDIYAMGGEPIMAIAILGWPVDKLPASVAHEVVAGARQVCENAGIMLAGGHSIDAPEPIFGLAVTGRADRQHIKTNDGAKVGSVLYLTKPLGIGIITTAQKRGIVKQEDLEIARNLMLTLNDVGKALGKVPGVSALTDVTGFGLLGHLIEVCDGSDVSARINTNKVPIIPSASEYLALKCVPGGTNRNFTSYGNKVSPINNLQKNILCDPQTSGGLLVAVNPDSTTEVENVLRSHEITPIAIGEIIPRQSLAVLVE